MAMNLEDYLHGFEKSVDALPRHLIGWDRLPEAVRDGYFEELIGMLARRRPAERLATSLGRDDVAARLAVLHGRLLDAIAAYGWNAGFSAADFVSEVADVSDVVVVQVSRSNDLAQAA
ncbi:MAG TPA: hypothetical protein VGD74_03730 [Vulgatibacter sp.]